MKFKSEHPELSTEDRHLLAELIVETDGVSYEQAITQIANFQACDLSSSLVSGRPVEMPSSNIIDPVLNKT